MKTHNIYRYLDIDDYSSTPKYLQLANSIIKTISDGILEKNDPMPSLNELCFEFEISRDTAEKSYNYLKKRNILCSVKGKGFYINRIDVGYTKKILLLFNKMSDHKKLIYEAFVSNLNEGIAIDFYVYNNDFVLFKKLLTEKMDDYNYYVIIPHFLEGGENAYEIINTIPKNKLVLLDKLIPNIKGEFCAVYENFEKDIYQALTQGLERLRKYHTIKLVFPEYTYHPEEIVKGFKRFCHQYSFKSIIVRDINEEPIRAGEVYINLMENDLVTLIERILSTTDLEVGKDVGVISYNEIPLKKIILNGITTISTNFKMMGERAAEMIMGNCKKHTEIPFSLTLRDSL